MMHNEPRVVPITPGQVLVRLSEIIGAVKQPSLSEALPQGVVQNLEAARQNLISAIESADREAWRNSFENAQHLLMKTYEVVSQPGTWKADEAARNFKALGFPDPLQQHGSVQTVDVATVLATFTQPERQVFMSLSFDDAPGAIAYWLRETRVIAGEEIHDYLIENYAPVFQRVRLAAGPHRFRIQSRNLHQQVLSDEFTIIIPERI